MFKNINKFGIVLAILMVFSSYAEQNSSISKYKIITKNFPNSSVLSLKELDTSECSLYQSPFFIIGDFNGNGRVDYAALVKIGGGQSKELNGQKYTVYNVWLVVITSNLNGLRKDTLSRFEEVVPVLSQIDIKKKGSVLTEPQEGEKKVQLKYPGIALYHCGKSAVVFYWDKNGYKEIWIAD